MKKQIDNDIAATYEAFKQFEGRRYSGMKIGRSHKWYYDRGEWKEKKITPDEWEITYAVKKRRAGKAPEGSGVPVGTQYHWYILAHQNVTKLNANDYSTSMTGIKFKLAHKRADHDKWSASDRAQRKRLIDLLRKVALSLEQQSAEEETKKKTEETTTSRRQAAPSLSKAKKPEKPAPARKTKAA